MRAPPIANRLELLSAPFIEIRNAYDEIDLEELGDDDLETYIQYDGIAEGDQLRIHWRGATASGEALDSVGTVVEVEQPDFDPLKKRLRVLIGNRYVSQGDQGYAFYYYERISGSPAESLRTFSFVGVRPHRMEHMPVTQAVESHALHIDPDALGSSGATFVAPPYAAMQEGDTVTLVFRGYEASGDFDEENSPSLSNESAGTSMNRSSGSMAAYQVFSPTNSPSQYRERVSGCVGPGRDIGHCGTSMRKGLLMCATGNNPGSPSGMSGSATGADGASRTSSLRVEPTGMMLSSRTENTKGELSLALGPHHQR